MPPVRLVGHAVLSQRRIRELEKQRLAVEPDSGLPSSEPTLAVDAPVPEPRVAELVEPPPAEKILSGYMDRAAAGLVQLVTEEHRKVASKPTYGEVVELVTSLYAQAWFDSSTERDAANILEDAPDISTWLRLQIGDLPILWTEAREYNPDLIAIDREVTHWVVEVKMDKEMQSADVQRKRGAARRWANYVSGDEKVGACWRYLLVSETDVKNPKGSWDALKGLGGV